LSRCRDTTPIPLPTAKRHGRDPLELIKTVLLKAGDTPLDALYDPDCLSKNDSS
jgi:hypothetical protein